MPRITYHRVAPGKYETAVYPDQCKVIVDPFHDTRCQGATGHTDNHWCYTPAGSYFYVTNPPDEYHAAGWIPPGHATYVHPAGKQKDYFNYPPQRTPVTDPALIARLDREELFPNESLSEILPAAETEGN